MRSKVTGAPPSVTRTLAVSPVTEAVEVLATVAPQPPSVPELTWFWRGGVDPGIWKVGVGGGGSTVVEPRAATPDGGEQLMSSGVAVPWITKVTSALICPGVMKTFPCPGPVWKVTGL